VVEELPEEAGSAAEEVVSAAGEVRFFGHIFEE
jgi:hypothetical protein